MSFVRGRRQEHSVSGAEKTPILAKLNGLRKQRLMLCPGRPRDLGNPPYKYPTSMYHSKIPRAIELLRLEVKSAGCVGEEVWGGWILSWIPPVTYSLRVSWIFLISYDHICSRRIKTGSHSSILSQWEDIRSRSVPARVGINHLRSTPTNWSTLTLLVLLPH